MHIPNLPIAALPAWSKLNSVDFLDIHVQDLGTTKGFGLVTSRALNSRDTFDIPTLMVVPDELVLSAGAVQEWMKVDGALRELIGRAGGKSARSHVMLFLLMQITIAARHHGMNIGASNPWTEYVRLLPDNVPVPTLWSEEEQAMLVGTSLETAIAAKTASLIQEFEELREKTTGIVWCQKCWWELESLTYQDWFLLDAWYRSRCLEVPNAGESMIPCVDIVNHSAEANSYYERTSDNNIALLLRPGMQLDAESEITISYGSSKTEAEMLFSYGFIDKESTVKGLTLTIDPFPDDPLGRAKAAAFSKTKTVCIYRDREEITWDCPFLYFMSLNEEDGLEFKVLQETDGSLGRLRVFFQDTDVTAATDHFELYTSGHERKDIFRLRVVAMLQDRIQQQLERLYGIEDTVQSLESNSFVSRDRYESALQLRTSEVLMLEEAYEATNKQKAKLMESEVVQRYLGTVDHEDKPEPEETIDEDDFS
ncbi:hypothetical protein QTJ16_004991 [Diplocarpon rosae]|uniref:SET domain-containing protein n=1 Tax=Diplocarpon rosae TaxID=946125 RepID=A0AAD9SYY0_9HELO|nr:hypothetical protein QTJ16_004991 [Diplocarpon rosae]